MNTTSQQSKGRDGTPSTLNMAIEDMNLAGKISCITPAKAVFGSASFVLSMIRDTAANELHYVEVGLSCADVCKALDRGLNGMRSDELSRSVLEAIEQLAATLSKIQKNVVKQGKRSVASRLFHAKSDKDAITAWRLDLLRILHVFNTELAINTHSMVVDIHRNVLTIQGGTQDQIRINQTSVPVGEMPPPPPRACFGRDEIIEKIIGLAENLTPIALIGAGGIGKTSIALAVLHHDRIKQRFGDNRRFIRCDQFPASRPNFLNRLSKAIGAGVDNPEDLVPLRSSLSSTKMFIVLDNAESIFDPRGTNGHEIYSLVEELCQFDNICLTITSRITTVPPDCKHLNVPTLSMDAARSTFYRIYGSRERTDIIDNIIVQLDFHPLSVTLLATVAHQSMWDHCELAREWQRRQTGVLHTEHSKSLAAAIELSLASPTFLELGSNARDLLGVIAFFPQGVNRNNLDWLFPTIPDRTNLFDKFCILSLTNRNNGYITMLAPLRDYLRPKDPNSSPLLRATKERYFTRISAVIDPNNQVTFGETRWITLEDENVEHLLDVLTSLDMVPEDIWDACANFLRYLCWHKKRQTVLRFKIEGLPDNHPSKPTCLFGLARLFHSVGNHTEQKRLLTHVLRLRREREDDYQVAHTLESLSNANRLLGLREEGIQQAREALKIFEQLGDMAGQAGCLITLAWLLYEVGQLDAAETAASYAIILLPEKGEQFLVCRSHRILGDIYYSKGEREKAIHNFDVAVGIASVFNWHNELFWIHYSLALLFFNEDGFDDAHIHIKQAISHGINHANYLGYAALLQAAIWYRQHELEEATSAALRAYEIFDKSGATNCRVACTNLLEDIERAIKSRPTTSESNSNAHSAPSNTPTDAHPGH